MSDDRDKAIRERAYALWQKSGSPHGQHGEHWDQAVREIDAEAAPARPKPGRKAAAAPATPVARRKPGPKPKIATAEVSPEPKAESRVKPASKAAAVAKAAPVPKPIAAKAKAAPVKPKADAAPAAHTCSKAKQAADKVIATVKRATKGSARK